MRLRRKPRTALPAGITVSLTPEAGRKFSREAIGSLESKPKEIPLGIRQYHGPDNSWARILRRDNDNRIYLNVCIPLAWTDRKRIKFISAIKNEFKTIISSAQIGDVAIGHDISGPHRVEKAEFYNPDPQNQDDEIGRFSPGTKTFRYRTHDPIDQVRQSDKGKKRNHKRMTIKRNESVCSEAREYIRYQYHQKLSGWDSSERADETLADYNDRAKHYSYKPGWPPLSKTRIIKIANTPT